MSLNVNENNEAIIEMGAFGLYVIREIYFKTGKFPPWIIERDVLLLLEHLDKRRWMGFFEFQMVSKLLI